MRANIISIDVKNSFVVVNFQILKTPSCYYACYHATIFNEHVRVESNYCCWQFQELIEELSTYYLVKWRNYYLSKERWDEWKEKLKRGLDLKGKKLCFFFIDWTGAEFVFLLYELENQWWWWTFLVIMNPLTKISRPEKLKATLRMAHDLKTFDKESWNDRKEGKYLGPNH